MQFRLIAIMAERHWWFASKLQETFHFGGYDNPTLLEDFLSEPEVVELINDVFIYTLSKSCAEY